MSLEIDIMFGYHHHKIPYHKIVTIMGYNAISTKNVFTNLDIKWLEKR
ncbi:MAG TPA: hypothetical protein PKX34_03185 [Candidatus Absconditabacterales bacterium]|nr:hypothetical protein [Candidatus Absconditabacterales bacterium]HPK28192.1 hypothetical protein [Candidatus Absconditabacterales bacterium]